MIRNLNANYGMTTENNAPVFSDVAEYTQCLMDCGFIADSREVVEGVDYEEIDD